MSIDGADDIEALKHIGGICRDVLRQMGERIAPGVTPRELDDYAGRLLAAAGAVSAPRLAYNFPGETCISVGEDIAHGVPNDVPLQEGQLVNIDVSAEKNGYFGDCGQSFAVGKISTEAERLLKATKRAQYEAMMAVRAGVPIRRVGEVVVSVAKKYGYQVVEGLNGHGVGRWIHEGPTISNVPIRGDRRVFEKGMVVTIEPFLATKSRNYVEMDDGWTLRLDAGGLGAQFEHSFIVTDGAPIILTA